MDNVRGKVIACDRVGSGWSLKPVALPENGNVGISHAEHFGASVSFSFTDFLTPSSIIWSDNDGETLATVKSQPARFDASPYVSEQFEARSKDGTMIPYFVVRRRDQKGPVPTLLYGYGGFEVPLLPGYAGVRGRLWLEKGNAYVQANIRGGGEFGPAWHQAALKGNRQNAFDDFAAVAQDVVRRGIATRGFARHPGRLEWRPAHRRLADAAPRAVRRRHHRRAAARHAALHRTAARRFVDGRIWRSVEAGRGGVAWRLLALPACRGRRRLSAGAA